MDATKMMIKYNTLVGQVCNVTTGRVSFYRFKITSIRLKTVLKTHVTNLLEEMSHSVG